jgi:hypothetical protein
VLHEENNRIHPPIGCKRDDSRFLRQVVWGVQSQWRGPPCATTVYVRQSGNMLAGTGGPNTGEQYSIENGKVDGNRLMFEITTGEWKFTYDLKATGEGIAGTLELRSVNDRRTATVSMKKVK